MLHVSDHEIVDMEQLLKGDVSLDVEIPDRDCLTALENLVDNRMNWEEMLWKYQQEL